MYKILWNANSLLQLLNKARTTRGGTERKFNSTSTDTSERLGGKKRKVTDKTERTTHRPLDS